MKRPSKVLKFLAAGLLFACGNAFSEKPVFSECPCWDSEPGLLDAIVALGETTCVESLVYTKDGGVAKNWLLRTVTPPETVCFQFELTSSPDISTNGCVDRLRSQAQSSHSCS